MDLSSQTNFISYSTQEIVGILQTQLDISPESLILYHFYKPPGLRGRGNVYNICTLIQNQICS